ncbi:MAG TPA: class I adenylate-forming enzyme family protein [Candidatus Binataceae bacterium]|nr:class I adenylate-forming enzyme family protein [Candidatus Binataceae bacterium]
MAYQNPFARRIQEYAQRFPEKIFLESVDQGKSITYGQLDNLTNQLAGFLAAKGFGANQRVTLLSGNSLEHLVVFLGVLRYGGTICTINTDTNRAYLPQILMALRPKLVLFEEATLIDGLADCPVGEWQALGDWQPAGGTGLFSQLTGRPSTLIEPVCEARDDAVIVYTSGTTSLPKGAVIGYSELAINVDSIAETLALGADDRMLEFRSLNWVSAQELGGLAPLFRGATLMLARKFSQSHYFEWLRGYRATIGICNPTGIAMLVNRPVPITAADLPGLRFITSSSAALTAEHWRTFEAMYGIPIAQGYGSSEALWIACSNEKSRRFGSVGRPFPSQRIAIVDPDGVALPAGEAGEVEVGGDPETRYRYLCYDGTIETTSTGRIRPGDIGYLDADGYLYLTGRARELIIRGGVNISPLEIDNILLEVSGVAEAAAIGVPDQIYGEEVVAYVVSKPGEKLSAELVLEHCRAKLPALKIPKEIFFRESLPKNDRGKLDRKALAAEWRSERTA